MKHPSYTSQRAYILDGLRTKTPQIRAAMKALNWTWRGDSEPPSDSEMLITADHLLQAAFDHLEQNPDRDWIQTGTGGFLAEARRSADGIEYSVSFVLTEVSGEYAPRRAST